MLPASGPCLFAYKVPYTPDCYNNRHKNPLPPMQRRQPRSAHPKEYNNRYQTACPAMLALPSGNHPDKGSAKARHIPNSEGNEYSGNAARYRHILTHRHNIRLHYIRIPDWRNHSQLPISCRMTPLVGNRLIRMLQVASGNRSRPLQATRVRYIPIPFLRLSASGNKTGSLCPKHSVYQTGTH